MDEFDDQSRINKFDKRRKNTRNISIFLIIGAALLIVLIALFVWGGSDNTDQPAGAQDSDSVDASSENEENSHSNEENSESSADSGNTEEEQSDGNSNEMTIEDDDKEIESLESEDNVVIEAYTKHWDPVGTEQSGDHTVVYDDGSQDRVEMNKAIQTATGLNKQDITYLWLSNNGDQKVLATFSDSSQEEHYRVYLSWVNNEGWQPTKVEILKKNDQMHRFK